MSAQLGIGTATFIPGYGLAPAGSPDVAVLQKAIASGIGYIDTAAGYGESEAAIGRVAEEIAARGVRVCSKMAPPATIEAAREGIHRSLQAMRASKLDTMLLHSVDRSIIAAPAIEQSFGAIAAEGVIDRLGASTYGVADAAATMQTAWCTSVQVEYSILNQSVVRALTAAKRTGFEVVVRSVLAKGLLTDAVRRMTLPPHVRATIDPLRRLAESWGMTLSNAAIRFALDTPGIDVVLVGIGSQAELDAALLASSLPPLTLEQWQQLAAFDRSAEDWTHPERWPEGRIA